MQSAERKVRASSRRLLRSLRRHDDVILFAFAQERGRPRPQLRPNCDTLSPVRRRLLCHHLISFRASRPPVQEQSLTPIVICHFLERNFARYEIKIGTHRIGLIFLALLPPT